MQTNVFLDDVPVTTTLNLDAIPEGTITYHWLKLVSDGFGNPISLPVIIAKGKLSGPTLGLTAAVHGNELNGIPVIQRLFAEIEPAELKGTIIGVPVVNVPSFMRKQRRFVDGVDLNHIMPGIKNGNVSQTYAYRFIEKVIKQLDYLIDLHTASFGRINSYYVRADMSDDATRQLALLQNADIIVHNPPSDGTLRGAADELGIPAITLEVGNPSVFQRRLIRSGIEGVHNVLCKLDMIDDTIEPPSKQTIICDKSYWLYTETGGILTLDVDLLDAVGTGDRVAIMRNIFGKKIGEYHAKEGGIVIGKSVSPVNQSGGRILHLGIVQN